MWFLLFCAIYPNSNAAPTVTCSPVGMSDIAPLSSQSECIAELHHYQIVFADLLRPRQTWPNLAPHENELRCRGVNVEDATN